MQLHRKSSQSKPAGSPKARSKKGYLYVAGAYRMNLKALTHRRGPEPGFRTLAAAAPRVIWGHPFNRYTSRVADEPLARLQDVPRQPPAGCFYKTQAANRGGLAAGSGGAGPSPRPPSAAGDPQAAAGEAGGGHRGPCRGREPGARSPLASPHRSPSRG